LEAGINPYEIMLILNPEVGGERHDDIVERVRQLVVGGDGAVVQLDDWGERRIAFPMGGQATGRYMVLTCDAPGSALSEIERVLSINKDVVLRSQTIRLSRAQAEIQREKGAQPPADDRPDGESPFPRPQRPQRRRSR
jgi:small subunit ribosomal protein S6